MKNLILLSAILMLLVTGCKKDQVVDNGVAMSVSGLENLGSDYVYEGWLIVDGSPVSTGTFSVDDAGTPSQTSFSAQESDIEAATTFVLSIEPASDPDPAPSAVKFLAGDFDGNMAPISTGIVGDFSNSTGKFIIATPTTTSSMDDLSGVWFIDNGNAGLDLPALEAGWAYEGWAVIDGTPVSTGTFTSTDGADDSAPFSGTDASGPAFPGEDFIMNAPAGLTFPTDLTNMPIVVSIEPVPDNSSAPFTLKPLSGSSPASGTTVGTPYSMTNNSGMFPTGSVTKNLN